uniref:DedA family protein n=1 Tax=Schlesneria paludicola TaxID=360056 RepID=A0A7C4LK38_9PLAN
MDYLEWCLDLVLHLDQHFEALVEYCGIWTYVILFAIVFCETGLVVTPFLPGDSLLFGAGAVAALKSDTLNIGWVVALLTIAAIVGDTVNYWIGRWVGPRAFSGKIRFLQQKHLLRTQEFYERYGGKTIILARFVPIVRTFAPFVAGIGLMNYRQFIAYNVIGGILWVVICTLGGYFFGNIPWVKDNFEIVVVAIVAISVLPMAWEFAMELRRRKGGVEQPASVEVRG